MRIQNYEVILLRSDYVTWERHIRIFGKNALCKSNYSIGEGRCSLIYYSKHRMSTYDLLCKECCDKLPNKIHNQLKHNLIIVKLKK